MQNDDYGLKNVFADVFAVRIQSFCVGILHGHGKKHVIGDNRVHVVANHADFLHFGVAGAVWREINLVFDVFCDVNDHNFSVETAFEAFSAKKTCLITIYRRREAISALQT